MSAAAPPPVATRDAVIAEIQRILRAELSVDAAVEPETKIFEGLALDSLGLVTVVVGLEDKFKVALTEEDALGVVTVGDLVTLVARKQAPAAGGP